MRLLRAGLVGSMIMALACSPTSTASKTRATGEGGAYSTPSDGGVSGPSSGAGGGGAGGGDTTAKALLATMAASAQWTQTNGAASGGFFKLYTSQDEVFARTWDSLNGGRAFLTSDNGATWTQIGSADTDIDILSIAVLNANILAGTWEGFYLSTSGGASWSALTPSGLPANTAIRSVATIDTSLFAGTLGGIYKSSDNGSTWAAASSGIPANATMTSIVASGTALFAGSDSNGVFITTNRGTSWAAINSGLTDVRISQLAVLGTKLFAVTLTGVFVSTDNGTSWTADSSGLKNINCILVVDDRILAGTDSSGVYLSADSGATWASFNSGMPDGTRVWSLTANGANIFAGTDSGVWRTPSIAVPNSPPTIATAASASPNPVAGKTTSLSALGADDAGEANLTYTWSTLGTPPATVTFSVNGTNAAQNTTATFGKAGGYTLQVSVKDQPGLTATSSVGITVDQTPTSIVVSPAIASVAPLLTQQFAATAQDQFATALITQPTFAWSVSGGGTIDANGLFTAAAAIGGPYTVTAGSGALGGTATVSVAVPNVGPSITSPAAAAPNPSTGSTTALSVLGGDDAGEASLTYTWATTGTPPAAVTFSANSTNAAKNTMATFTKAGSYTFQVTVADQSGSSVTSQVTVTVNQALTSIVVSPTSATVKTSASQQFTATARDQFGATLATQPTFAWTVGGGGGISSSGLFSAGSTAGGPYTVTATAGGNSGTASVTVSSTPTTVYQINCGSSSAASPFTADQYGSGGTLHTVTNTITISGITNPAPQAVYQSERYGNSTYTLPNLTSGSQYTVRLHFAELYQTATGKRIFNVAINGTTLLSNFDIYASAGARYKAVVRELTATANTSGQIVINFQTVTDNATIGGIEIITQTPNNPPSIATAASAAPNPVSGTTASLAVLGTDDGGESNLTYTWATTGTPPATVTFGANGTSAAKNTAVTFTKAGSYTFQVTVKDPPGLTATSSVTVTVNPTPTSVVVSPSSATVNVSATQQFAATARDQFATNLTSQPTFSWTVSGGGGVNSSGLFTAGSTAGGPYTVTATTGGVKGTASVTVSSTPSTVYQIDCGGAAASPYTADQYYSGGTGRTVTSSITTTGVTNPAPQAVYQAERYGATTYTLPSLTAGASYTVRLHFVELYWTASGKRKFDVLLNGTTVLSSYDIYAATGARYKAVVREFTTTANASGQIVIKLNNVTDNATLGGIQIIRQ